MALNGVAYRLARAPRALDDPHPILSRGAGRKRRLRITLDVCADRGDVKSRVDSRGQAGDRGRGQSRVPPHPHHGRRKARPAAARPIAIWRIDRKPSYARCGRPRASSVARTAQRSLARQKLHRPSHCRCHSLQSASFTPSPPSNDRRTFRLDSPSPSRTFRYPCRHARRRRR